MDRLTITQRIKIIKTYHKKGDSATATYRAVRGDYGLPNRKTVKKFGQAGVVKNIERPMHHRFVHSTENITIVVENPNVSIPSWIKRVAIRKYYSNKF